MAKFNTSTPSGFPEFSPAQEQVRQHWIQTIQRVYAAHGFQPITTPLVEREKNLLGKGGNPKEIYALKRIHDDANDQSHSSNALRFDHTVPLALYVARQFNEISFPFRRQAIGPVFRGERAQKGRYRQFDQCDIDVIGSEKLSFFNDVEMVAIIAKIFTELNIGNFVIRINNRKILRGFFASLGIADDQIKATLDIVDDLEKLPKEKIMAAFADQGLDEKSAEKIIEFTKYKPAQILESNNPIAHNETFLTGIKELKTVINGIEAFGVPAKQYQIDLAIARGLDYYTGTVYETKLIDHPGIGSICSGGRYEDLAEIFTGKKLPGVGISIGLTRLLFQLFDAKIIEPTKSSPCQILAVAQDDEFLPQIIELSQELRALGYATETYLETKKTAKKFDYAAKLGIPFVAILGQNEVTENAVMLKNMTTGEQTKIPRKNLASALEKLMK